MLKMAGTVAANAMLLAGSIRPYRRWRRATSRVSDAQLKTLWRIINANARTRFGREHEFQSMRSITDYQKRVPLRAYSDFIPYIELIGAGEQKVLTSHQVLRFERSSGSTTASKLIPYTRALQVDFQRGIDPWLYSLYSAHPELLTGKQYWSITPVGDKPERTAGGIPIGFEDDSEYFGPLKRFLVRSLMAVPSAVSRIGDIEIFRYSTLRFLLQCRDLVFISIWNPTFLTLLLDSLHHQSDALMMDIARGTLKPMLGLDAGLRAKLEPFLIRDSARASEIASAFAAWHGRSPLSRDERGRTLYEKLWPKLSLISCWADGAASAHALRLRKLFPSVAIQPKGLLATEGFISFPLAVGGNAALSVHSHFFEFTEEADVAPTPSRIKLAHELEKGKHYSVIITTSGGLYRYLLQDKVEVTGFIAECPLLRFEGKQDAVSDLFGEKLNEIHVRHILDEELIARKLPALFCLLAPEEKDAAAFYTLFVQLELDGVGTEPEKALLDLAAGIEQKLQENYHYRYSRRLGQLHPLRVFRISETETDPSALFIETCGSLGQRLGNVKPALLHSYRGWARVFPGHYLQPELDAERLEA
jgi:hypothetical protein